MRTAPFCSLGLGQEGDLVVDDDRDQVNDPKQRSEEEVEDSAQDLAAGKTDDDTKDDIGNGNDRQDDADEMAKAKVAFAALR